MKKIFLSALLLISVIHFSSAQALQFSPNDTFTHTGPLVDSMNQIEVHGTVTNTTASTDEVTWYVNEINHPLGWEMSVCDVNNCYLIYNTGDRYKFTAPAGVSQVIWFGATPFCEAGTGNIEITMWLKADSAATVAKLNFNATYTGVCVTGIEETLAEQVNIYPSNFQEKITIEGIETAAVKSVRLFNAAGELSMTLTPTKGNVATLETSQLAAGVYILRLETPNGTVTKKLVKL